MEKIRRQKKKFNWSIINCQLSIAFLLSLLLCSCQEKTVKNPQVTITVQPQISGVWQTSGERPWKLTLAEDGNVLDVLRSDGLHFEITKGSFEMPPVDNIYAKYVFGPCMWSYDPASRRLDVILIVEDMVIRTDQQEFKCSFIDEFSGILSEDGTTWTPTWILTTKYAQPRPEQVVDNGIQTFKKIQ